MNFKIQAFFILTLYFLIMTEALEIKINNLKFDCITSGNKEDELVLFLHGFPESSYMWQKLIANISKNGFFCIAPNLRGYSIDACPEGKENYTLDKLATDVFNIFKFFNKPKFHLVGHDWGAAIGWKVVHDYKDLIFSWTAISVPHIQAFGNAMVNDVEQNKMSQYIKNFQLPSLPEMEIQKK